MYVTLHIVSLISPGTGTGTVHLLVHCTCSAPGVCTCSLEELIANGRERVVMDVHATASTLCFINQSRYRYICFYIHCTCSASGVLYT